AEAAGLGRIAPAEAVCVAGLPSDGFALGGGGAGSGVGGSGPCSSCETRSKTPGCESVLLLSVPFLGASPLEANRPPNRLPGAAEATWADERGPGAGAGRDS